MQKQQTTCDGCGADLSDGGTVKHRLHLRSEWVLPDEGLSLGKSLLERDYHFCGVGCLARWSNNEGVNR